eukprot:403340466
MERKNIQNNQNNKKPQTKPTQKPQNTLEEVKQFRDYECPICYELIAEPVVTMCKHLFCLSCQNQVLQQNKVCPMCRKAFTKAFIPQIDKKIQQKIQDQFPQEFEKRKVSLIQAGLWRGSKAPVQFTFGNLYKQTALSETRRNLNVWVMYISLANDPTRLKAGRFIESVTFHLHPDFTPNVIVKKESPFLITKLGWGEFEIKMEVEFKKWTGIPKMELQHMLCFEEQGKEHEFVIDIDESLEQQS